MATVHEVNHMTFSMKLQHKILMKHYFKHLNDVIQNLSKKVMV